MKEFFDILINTTDEILCAVNMLMIRGFLIDKKDDGWYMSDNSHIRDLSDLNNILTQNHLGEVDKNGKIILNRQVNVDILETMFNCEQRVGFESDINHRNWQWFRRREHGYKIPTMCLEPFVAMYVKAVSSCGIETWFSCDGNNHRNHAIELGMNDTPNIFWHKLLWKKILEFKFELPWEREYQYISLLENKYIRYAELNKAAMFLYEHRKQLRDMKKNVMSVITPSKEKSFSTEEIEFIIENRADDYLRIHNI